MQRNPLVLPAWVAAVSLLLLLAAVGIVWTIELVHIGQQITQAGQGLQEYFRQFTGGLGGNTACPGGAPSC